MVEPSKELELFPTNETEIKGQFATFGIVLGNLVDLLIRKGVLRGKRRLFEAGAVIEAKLKGY